jgi:hypothetical protein
MEKCGLRLVHTTPFEGADVIEGAEHGQVEYALTKPEWEARTAGNARNSPPSHRGNRITHGGQEVATRCSTSKSLACRETRC